MNPEELKHIAVLQAIDDDALARLAAALEEKHYADGQTVFTEGDPGDSMYFIAKGCVRIEKRTPTVHKILTTLEAGDYFGEMALLDQKPRSAAAVHHAAWRRGRGRGGGVYDWHRLRAQGGRAEGHRPQRPRDA